MVRPFAVVAICRAVRLASATASHTPTTVVRCRGLGRKLLHAGLGRVQRLIITSRLQARRLFLLAVIVGGSLVSRRGVVRVLTVALSFQLLIAILRYFHQTPMSWIGISLVSAGDATVGEVTVLEIVRLLLLDVVGLCAASAYIHEIHVVALVLLQLALLLLLGLQAQVHLVRDVQGHLFVGPRMSIEELVRLLGAQEEDPVLQVLLLELRHFLIHDQGLREVFELALALSFHFGVDLDEHFEVPRHHVRQWVAAGLHFLESVIDLLDLLLPLELALLGLQVVQDLEQRLDLCHALLAQLADV